ncbi:phosphoribosylformylglycinamidine synthase subunit PurS, partial [bacterium]|nr:phosphoribosylformylglycinamidine synthase subunit PurS [bacterium]
MTTPVHTIETTLKSKYDDPVAKSILSALREEGLDGIQKVRRVNIFKIKANLDNPSLEKIASRLLADAVTEKYRVNSPYWDDPSDNTFEVAFNPGVMDPVEQSALKALTELGITGVEGVKTGSKFLFEGDISEGELNEFAGRYLYNTVIQHPVEPGEDAFPVMPPYEFKLKTVKLSGLSDDELLEISRDGLLSLNVEEMKTVQAYFENENRDPTDVELETMAQTWSEHCNHKTFRSNFNFNGEQIPNLLKSTIFKATNDLDLPWCVSVFKDNAGVIEFDENFDLCFKVETHNHPSAL